jgi:Ca-activated chloride channel family protein
MSVTFIWPSLLWGFLLIPVLLAIYLRVMRRPVTLPVAYSTAVAAADAALRGSRMHRHLPAALLLLALLTTLTALARPVTILPVPADRSALMLAIDVSGSMRSQDIAPNRLEAAKSAAKEFVAALPARVRVGLVAFGGYAQLVVPPVTDHARVSDAIDGLGFVRRTAIGEGLLEAVAALPERARPDADGTLAARPSGPRPPGIVILLSDGRSNTGIDPLEAADIARRQEVTVYTVGVGKPFTPDNTWTVGGPLDEETLKEMARLAGGVYYHASSAEALRDIYRKLARTVGWERRPQEVSAIAAALAAAALLAALAVSRLIMHPLGV